MCLLRTIQQKSSTENYQQKKGSQRLPTEISAKGTAGFEDHQASQHHSAVRCDAIRAKGEWTRKKIVCLSNLSKSEAAESASATFLHSRASVPRCRKVILRVHRIVTKYLARKLGTPMDSNKFSSCFTAGHLFRVLGAITTTIVYPCVCALGVGKAVVPMLDPCPYRQVTSQGRI